MVYVLIELILIVIQLVIKSLNNYSIVIESNKDTIQEEDPEMNPVIANQELLLVPMLI